MKNSARGELVEPCVFCASAVNPAFLTFVCDIARYAQTLLARDCLRRKNWM
jgi:hypothetical protein